MPVILKEGQPKNKNAVCYLRVSTAGQDTTSQKIILADYAKKNNFNILAWFEDFAQSGFYADRPQYQALKDYIIKNPGVTVLCTELDRSNRNFYEYVQLRKLCQENQTELLFLNTPKTGNASIDTLLENILASVAEYSRSIIQNTMMRGKLSMIMRGIPAVGKTPLGYDYIKRKEDKPPEIKVNPEEADLVRTIFSLYVNQNYSINKIRKKFKVEQVLTRMGRKEWSRSTIRQTLTNEAYIGRLFYNKNKQKPGTRSNELRNKKEWLLLKVSPIIDKTTFNKAQERIVLGLNKDPAGKKYDYLLSGLLYCGSCGRKYQFYHTNYGAPFARCSDRDRLTIDGHSDWCRNPAVKVAPLEDVVFTQVKYLILKPDKLYALFLDDRKGIINSIKQLETRCEELTERIGNLDTRRKRVVEAVASGALNLDDLKAYNHKTDVLKNQYLLQFKKYLEEIKKLNVFLQAEDYLNFIKKKGKFILNMDNLPFDKKRELVLEFVNKVIAFKQKNHYSIEFKLPIPKAELRLKGRSRHLQNSPGKFRKFVQK